MFAKHDVVRLGLYADDQVVTLSRDNRRRHIYAIGKTGTGKTTFLGNLMAADLENGRGFAFLDPHGDQAQKLAAITPRHRIRDIIYLDPSDLEHPFGFNPMHNVAPEKRPLVSAQIISAFAHIWGTTLETAPRMTYILNHSLRLLLDTPGTTLLGLPRVLSDSKYRDRLLIHARDPVVRSFWIDEFANFNQRYTSEAIAPVQNKIGTLLTDPALRNILGQTRSTIDLRRAMDEEKVVILNLSKGLLGDTTTFLLGALFTTAFMQAATARADTPEEQRIDFTLYADEFQHFATESFATILSEARKYRLSLVLAHQFLGQLPDIVRQAVIGNAGTIVCFRVGAEDTPLLSNELGIDNEDVATGLSNFTARLKTMGNNTPTEPRMLFIDPPAHPERDNFERVRNRSRNTYTRPRAHVEAKINRFFGSPS
jgi:type IV secretory pathway TraG/TraD family ATPase VirD4